MAYVLIPAKSNIVRQLVDEAMNEYQSIVEANPAISFGIKLSLPNPTAARPVDPPFKPFRDCPAFAHSCPENEKGPEPVTRC
jgi:hypothetical protein